MTYVDYDEKVDFTEYNSFNFYATETILNPAEEDILMLLIENNLRSKGFNSSVFSKFSLDFYVEFFEVGNSAVSANDNSSFSNNVNYVSITINFSDTLTNELFWQAVVERRTTRYISKEKKFKYFRELVNEALEQYPPKEEDNSEVNGDLVKNDIYE